MLPVLDEEIVRIRIAKRIALDLEDGSVVNLGIGIPTLVSDYVPEGRSVVTQTENGVVGAGILSVCNERVAYAALRRALSVGEPFDDTGPRREAQRVEQGRRL